MAYVIAEPCIGTKDSACVDACPVDCIHPKKDETGYGESQPALHRSRRVHRLRRLRPGLPRLGHLRRRRSPGEVGELPGPERRALRPLTLSTRALCGLCSTARLPRPSRGKVDLFGTRSHLGCAFLSCLMSRISVTVRHSHDSKGRRSHRSAHLALPRGRSARQPLHARPGPHQGRRPPRAALPQALRRRARAHDLRPRHLRRAPAPGARPPRLLRDPLLAALAARRLRPHRRPPAHRRGPRRGPPRAGRRGHRLPPRPLHPRRAPGQPHLAPRHLLLPLDEPPHGLDAGAAPLRRLRPAPAPRRPHRRRLRIAAAGLRIREAQPPAAARSGTPPPATASPATTTAAPAASRSPPPPSRPPSASSAAPSATSPPRTGPPPASPTCAASPSRSSSATSTTACKAPAPSTASKPVVVV